MREVMDINTVWYIKAWAIFGVFNLFALINVLLFHRKHWGVDLMKYRHYTSLIFQICGIVYALFLSFIVWDVWERYYDVNRKIQNEAKNVVDLYRNSEVFDPEVREAIRLGLEDYLRQVVEQEWPQMESPGSLRKGDNDIQNLWRIFIDFVPDTDQERIWYAESLKRLNALADARLTRIFNNANSVGTLRWILLIAGGLFLVTMPCFFQIDLLALKFFLTFFLANILAFLLFIIFSLDHPFTGHIEIDPQPLEYALQTVQRW